METENLDESQSHAASSGTVSDPFQAVWRSDVDALRAVKDINQYNSQGHTLLHIAVFKVLSSYNPVPTTTVSAYLKEILEKIRTAKEVLDKNAKKNHQAAST